MPAASSASIAWQVRTMRRRSKRSATCPDIRISTTDGRNCTSPTMPSISGSRVRSYICQPTATVKIW